MSLPDTSAVLVVRDLVTVIPFLVSKTVGSITGLFNSEKGFM